MHGATQAKLRGMQSDRVTERRFRQDEKFEEVELEYQNMEFLYEDGDFCVFMHPETFEQVNLPKESLGSFLPYLEPNQTMKVELLDGEPLLVNSPNTVDLRVESTPEPLHMDDSSVPKEATLANGMEVQVPQFVKEGDTVRIDVETGRFVERVR
jgi:elongation factor P